MEKLFIVTHLHGCLRSLETVLGKWDTKEETLIILGDTNDYGSNSYLVHRRLLQMKEQFPEKVYFLKGSHELYFERFKKNPSVYAEDYFNFGGIPTIASYYEDGLSYEEINNTSFLVNEVLPKIDFVDFEIYLSKCVDFLETESFIFISKESDILKEHMYSSWDKTNKKKLFTSLVSDEAFRINYFSNLEKESLAFKTHRNEIPYSMIISRSFPDLNLSSIKHREHLRDYEILNPSVTAFKTLNAEVLEKITVPIER